MTDHARLIGILEGQMKGVQGDIQEIKEKVEHTNTLLATLLQQTPRPDEYKKLKTDVEDLKVIATRWKAMVAAAVFIGGLIIGLVNWVLDNYDRIKK